MPGRQDGRKHVGGGKRETGKRGRKERRRGELGGRQWAGGGEGKVLRTIAARKSRWVAACLLVGITRQVQGQWCACLYVW